MVAALDSSSVRETRASRCTMKHYSVEQVYEVTDWDEERREVGYRMIYERGAKNVV